MCFFKKKILFDLLLTIINYFLKKKLLLIIRYSWSRSSIKIHNHVYKDCLILSFFPSTGRQINNSSTPTK